jgi:hypothetical protein
MELAKQLLPIPYCPKLVETIYNKIAEYVK